MTMAFSRLNRDQCKAFEEAVPSGGSQIPVDCAINQIRVRPGHLGDDLDGCCIPVNLSSNEAPNDGKSFESA